MAAIKHTLQRQVFLPSGERLVAVVHVTKVGKKKKASFLCAAVTTEKPIQVYIYQVKKSDRGDNNFKKKLSWALRELKVLDGKDATKDIADFDMQFDKQYKWVASSLEEKNTFIQCLYKLSQRYLVQKPDFTNVPLDVLDEVGHTTDADHSVEQAEQIAMEVDTDYHALSPREESDLEMLMSQCDTAISNAEAFTEQLTKQLSVLDGANVYSIMGSEEQVLELMKLIDKALEQADGLEEKLDVYDHKLQSVKDLMSDMKDKDSLIQIRNNNHQKLLEELDSVINQFNFDHSRMKVLLDSDLMTSNGIYECTQEANALLKCMQAEITPALEKMTAVQEQRKRFSKLKVSFAKRLSLQLNNLFIHQGNDPGETLGRYSTELKLPQHHSGHRDLMPYAELMYWLKQVDKDSFNKLCKIYTDSLRRNYDRDVREFMDAGKQKLAPRLERRGTLPAGGRLQHMGGSTSSLTKPQSTRNLKSGSSTTLDSDSQGGSDPDIQGRVKFDQVFELVLSELGPWCFAEQNFAEQFFHLTGGEDDSPDMEESGEAPAVTSFLTVPSQIAAGLQRKRSSASQPWKVEVKPPTGQPEPVRVKLMPIENLGSGLQRRPSSFQEKQINAEVRQMMAELFPSLESELINFITFGDHLDNFNSLYMLVRMGEHVINAEDTGSFLSKTFANCLVHIKRNFDRFVQSQLDNIQEYKLPKKGKAGILPFVHGFGDFATQAEVIFKGSDRRNDLDKAYQRLVAAIVENISRVANESVKTPREVIKMENFHHLHGLLSKLKIASLDTQKKEAKQRYQEHTAAYVTLHLGRPMEKLSIFFEGVEAKVAQGVKAEEVGYQLAYNKAELRKHIKEYPGKEVKKNLENLYKKLEKHLCEEENLLQVVWRHMQDEFIKQYKHFEGLIAKCYPDAGITFEFTIGNLLEYFSEIAQSH